MKRSIGTEGDGIGEICRRFASQVRDELRFPAPPNRRSCPGNAVAAR